MNRYELSVFCRTVQELYNLHEDPFESYYTIFRRYSDIEMLLLYFRFEAFLHRLTVVASVFRLLVRSRGLRVLLDSADISALRMGSRRGPQVQTTCTPALAHSERRLRATGALFHRAAQNHRPSAQSAAEWWRTLRERRPLSV